MTPKINKAYKLTIYKFQEFLKLVRSTRPQPLGYISSNNSREKTPSHQLSCLQIVQGARDAAMSSLRHATVDGAPAFQPLSLL